MSKYAWYEIEIMELKADRADLQAQLAQAHRRIDQVEGWLEDKCIELGRLTETYEICHADHLHALKGNEQLEQQLAQCQQERKEYQESYEQVAAEREKGCCCEFKDGKPVVQCAFHLGVEQDLARLRDKLEAATGALGEHPDTEIDLAQRISELRDEARAYFHENTRLRQELEDEKARYVEYRKIMDETRGGYSTVRHS